MSTARRGATRGALLTRRRTRGHAQTELLPFLLRKQYAMSQTDVELFPPQVRACACAGTVLDKQGTVLERGVS